MKKIFGVLLFIQFLTGQSKCPEYGVLNFEDFVTLNGYDYRTFFHLLKDSIKLKEKGCGVLIIETACEINFWNYNNGQKTYGVNINKGPFNITDSIHREVYSDTLMVSYILEGFNLNYINDSQIEFFNDSVTFNIETNEYSILTNWYTFDSLMGVYCYLSLSEKNLKINNKNIVKEAYFNAEENNLSLSLIGTKNNLRYGYGYIDSITKPTIKKKNRKVVIQQKYFNILNECLLKFDLLKDKYNINLKEGSIQETVK